jgi:hydrogenase expression/formation protein HypC
MCLAIPAEIVEIDGDIAKVRVGDTDTFMKTSLMLLPEEPSLGDFLIIHAGFAMTTLDRHEALETIKLLREMANLLGEDGLGQVPEN